jgi:hypothetical protein
MIIFWQEEKDYMIHWRILSFNENMEQEYVVFWKSFNSILMFFSYFHDWIKVMNLDMSRSE